MNETFFKSGFIGVIGQPNAGKSTLVNTLIGEKVGIVSAKPQTTRQKVLGVYTDKSCQCIFIDAPGVIHAESGLNYFLQKEYEKVIEDSDVLMAVLNIDEKKPDLLGQIIQLVSQSKKPWIAVITKTDLGKIHRVDFIKLLLSSHNVPIVLSKVPKSMTETHRLSLKSQIFNELKKLLPQGELLYDSELFTPHTVRELCSEIIREECFLNLHQELPYELAVKIVKYDESQKNLDRIYAELIVDKPSHKNIIVGRKGQMIKRIGMRSRQKIESLIGKKVFLDLHVSIEPHWVKNKNLMKELGYDTHS